MPRIRITEQSTKKDMPSFKFYTKKGNSNAQRAENPKRTSHNNWEIPADFSKAKVDQKKKYIDIEWGD